MSSSTLSIRTADPLHFLTQTGFFDIFSREESLNLFFTFNVDHLLLSQDEKDAYSSHFQVGDLGSKVSELF